MAQDPLTTIENVPSLDRLAVLEGNFKRLGALTPKINAAIEARYADFGQEMVAAKTGIDLSDLSPAEARIVNAIGRYVALQKRDGKGAARTFQLIGNRGLIDAAEVTVARSKVTQGFEVLDQADMRALSFEQIIVDHPEEFSARAQWYARKTLGLGNRSDKPPADAGTLTQQRTERLLDWLGKRAEMHGGLLNGYSNADAGEVIGFHDLTRYGRVLGNIQSRIDFACYREGLPPLGLCVVEHFSDAWAQEGRKWSFPVRSMREAAQTHIWNPGDFDRIKATTRTLPGQAAIPWRRELAEHEQSVRSWAEKLFSNPPTQGHGAQKGSEADLDAEANAIIGLERKLLGRKPQVRERVSRTIERGSVGQKLKRANGYRCQICDALGQGPLGFIKKSGEPYVEAHHVTPVSELEVGSLSAGNILILCANHHRQMHYGNVDVERLQYSFVITIDHQIIEVNRLSLNARRIAVS